MKKTLNAGLIASVAVILSTAAFAQNIPLNILVAGSTGAETGHGQTEGTLTRSSTITTSAAGTVASMIVSSTSSTTTN